MSLPVSEPYPKALIRLGVSCNNSCVFCHSRAACSGIPDVDSSTIKEKIEAAALANVRMVVFSGGEPTIRKDIVLLCEYAREIGIECGLITNGRMFCYRDFGERIIEAGVKYVLFSIHGADSDTHNKLVGEKAFQQTMQGLENIARFPVHLVINTVLTKLNKDAPGRIAKAVHGLGPVHLKISLPEPKGFTLVNKDIVLSPNEAAECAKSISADLTGLEGITFGFDGFTPCLLDNYFSLNDDFHTHGFCLVSEMEETGFFLPDHGDRAYLPTCTNCSFRHICHGVYSNYIEWFPETQLSPFSQPVSSSIKFDISSVHKFESDEDSCSTKIISQPLPSRRAFVRRDNELHLYKTEEIYTGTEELNRIKIGLEQVYCIFNKNAGDDSGSPQKMQLSPKCSDCFKLSCCPGIFEPAEMSSVCKIEDRETALIERFAHGRVIQIGDSVKSSSNFIGSMLEDNRISFYAMLNPEINDASQKTNNENIVSINSHLEQFRWNEGPFDAVIIFRSWNNIEKIDLSMEAIRASTRIGSTLLVTENSRCITLQDQPIGEDVSKKNIGYSRNRMHDPDQVIYVLNKYGFHVVEVYPVENNTDNHWAVVAVRKH